MKLLGLLIVSIYCCVSMASFFVPDQSVTTRQLMDSAVTTAKINDGAVTGAKMDGSWPINIGSSVTQTTSSTSYTDVTGLNATITPSTGRVMALLAGGSTPCYIRASDATVAVSTADFKILAGAVDIGEYEMKANGVTSPNSLSLPGSSVAAVGTAIATGSSVTFKVQYKVGVGTTTAEVQNCHLVVFDLP